MVWRSLKEELQEQVDKVLKKEEEDRVVLVQYNLKNLVLDSLWDAANTIADASEFRIASLEDFKEEGELDYKKLKEDVIKRLSTLLELTVQHYDNIDESDDFRLIDEKGRLWYIAVNQDDNVVTASVDPYWLEQELENILNF